MEVVLWSDWDLEIKVVGYLCVETATRKVIRPLASAFYRYLHIEPR